MYPKQGCTVDMRNESCCLQLLQKRGCAARQSLVGKAGRWHRISASLWLSCTMLHLKGTNPTPQQGKRGHKKWFWEIFSLPRAPARHSSTEQTAHGGYSITHGTNLGSCCKSFLWTSQRTIEPSFKKSKNCQQLCKCEALQVSPHLELGTKAAPWCCPTVKAACKPLWVLVHDSRQRQKHPDSCSTIHSTPPSVPCEKAVLSSVEFQIHC